jgi:hypothetical protein
MTTRVTTVIETMADIWDALDRARDIAKTEEGYGRRVREIKVWNSPPIMLSVEAIDYDPYEVEEGE